MCALQHVQQYANNSSSSSMQVVKVKNAKIDVAPWNVHWIRMVLDGIVQC